MLRVPTAIFDWYGSGQASNNIVTCSLCPFVCMYFWNHFLCAVAFSGGESSVSAKETHTGGIGSVPACHSIDTEVRQPAYAEGRPHTDGIYYVVGSICKQNEFHKALNPFQNPLSSAKSPAVGVKPVKREAIRLCPFDCAQARREA
jgi:hypothetical protein